MTLLDAAEKLGLKPVAGLSRLSREFGQGYVSDLLSDVMANAKPGDIWVTLQIHQNIIAVATLKELAGIVLIGGRQPETQTLAKADEEQVPLLLSDLPAFEVVGRLYQLGITGRK